MAGVLFVVRSEARRRFASLALLAALVALVVAVVLGASAGAHRTATALDRFLSISRAESAAVYVQGRADPGAADRLDALPGVTEVATTNLYFVGAGTEFDTTVVSSPNDSTFRSVDRPLVLEGRMPADDAADEVAVSELAARSLGVGVGDHLSVPTFSQDEMSAFESGAAPFPDGFRGPALELTVVGRTRIGNELQGSAKDAGPVLIASPAFAATYEGRVARAGTLFPLGLEPDTDVEGLKATVSSLPVGGSGAVQLATVDEEWAGTVRAAVGVLATVLVAFAAVATVAGVAAVGQAVLRQLSLSSEVVEVTSALGATRSGRAWVLALPVAGAVVVGSVVGASVAFVASPVFPLAVARRAEPAPGLQFDAAVLLLGWALLVLVFVGFTATLAWRSSGPAQRPTAAVRNRLRVPMTSAALPASLGARLAVVADRSATRLPVRTTIAAVLVAMAGVVGVLVFGASLDATYSRPDRWGWTWSSSPDLGVGTGNVTEVGSVEAGVRAAVSDPDIDGLGLLFGHRVELDGQPGDAVTFDVLKGGVAPIALEGRPPTGPGEVAFGTNTMRRRGLAVGDQVVASTVDGRSVALTVVGRTVFPLVSNSDPGTGILLSPQAFAAVAGSRDLSELTASPGFDQEYDTTLLLRYRDGVDRPAAEDRLAATYALGFSGYSRPQPPGRLQNLRDGLPIVAALAVFFGVLGLIGLVHALLVTVRRRSRDFAVLEAFGMRRGQVRRVVTWQSVTVMSAGLVLGVPLGVVLGRAAWKASVGDLGMVDTPTVPIAFLVGVGLVGVVLAAVASLPPGWIAARRRPAETLRAE